jgi:hypothetical protein
MNRDQKTSQEHLNRLYLIGRVEVAGEQLQAAKARARRGGRFARAAAALAERRLRLLSRAMALMALGAWSPSPVAA